MNKNKSKKQEEKSGYFSDLFNGFYSGERGAAAEQKMSRR